MDFVEAVLGLLRIFLGLLLVLFIPGYALSWVIFPTGEDMDTLKRTGLAFVLSIASVLLSVLFSDIFLGIDSTPENIVLIILSCTIFFVIVWRIELFLYNRLVPDQAP